MIDRVFDRIARIIEVTLALAFIFAVLLNFTNVLGRYLFGISLLGADEVQIFIMIGMTTRKMMRSTSSTSISGVTLISR